MATGNWQTKLGKRLALAVDLFVPGAQAKIEAALNAYDVLKGKNRYEQKYTVVFPCNFKNALLGPSRVAGVELEIHNHKTLKQRVPASQMVDNLQLQFLVDPKECSFAVIEQKAHDYQEALDKAHNKMELVRSVINYYKSHPARTKAESKTDALSTIHPPKCAYIFNESHQLESTAPLMSDFPHTIVKFSDKEDLELRALVQHLDGIKKFDLKKMVCKLLLTHNNALDEPKTDEAFTLYWKSLDLVTIDKNLSRDEYLRRVSCLFHGDTNPMLMLYARRQKPHDVTTEDVNHMKSLSQNTISFLIDNSNHLHSTEGLRHLYENEKGTA